MVGRTGRAEFRPLLRILFPEELSTIHHSPADVYAVSTQEFGGGVDIDVDTMIECADEPGSYGVVHYDRNAVLVCDVGDLPEVWNVVLGISDGLEIDQAGVRVHQLFDLLGMVRI